jgi:chemotaxis protein MotB
MYRKQFRNVSSSSIHKPAKYRPALTFAGSLIAGLALAEALMAESTTIEATSTGQLPAPVSIQRQGIQQVPVSTTTLSTPPSDSANYVGTQHPFTRHSYQTLSTERVRELMDLDNQAIDDTAIRLKQIVKGRLEADYLNIQYLATIDELQRQIAELENSLQHGRMQQESLDSNRTTLEQALSNVTRERDDALNQLAQLNTDMQAQIGSVLTLKSETATAAEQLAAKELLLSDLNQQIDALTAERDNTQSRAIALENELAASNDSIEGLRNQLASVVMKRDSAREAHSLLETRLGETDSELLLLRGQLAENQQALDEHKLQVKQNEETIIGLEDQLATLNSEHNTALNQAAISTQQNEQTILSLEERLAALNTEHGSALDQAALRAQELTTLQAQLDALTQERDAAFATVDDLQQQLSDAEAQRTQYLSEFSQERELALASTEEARQELSQTQTMYEQQLNTLREERDSAIARAEQLQHSLAEAESSFNQQFSDLNIQREHAEGMTAQLQNALTESMALRDEELAQVSRERDDATANAAQLQADLSEAQAQIIEMSSANEQLNGELAFAKSKVADTDNALLSNQQLHEQTQLELFTLQSETQSLREKIRSLESEYDTLSSNSQQLELTRSELDAQLQQTVATLETRNTELQTALESADSLQAQINELTDERGELTRKVEDLNNQVVSLDSSMLDAKNSFAQQMTDTEQQFLTEKNSLEAALKARDADIAGYTDRIATLTSELEQSEQQASSLLVKKDESILSLQNAIDTTRAAQDKSRNELSQLNVELAKYRTQNTKLRAQMQEADRKVSAYEVQLNQSEETIQSLTSAQQAAEAEAGRLAVQAEELRVSLSEELNDAKLGNITVQNARDDNSIPIRLGNADFFETGSAALTKEGAEKLSRLAEIIDQYHNRRIVVEGHTDTVPIGVGLRHRYASNWDLSVARAATAVRHIQRATGIDPRSLSAAGYGEFRPIADNNTDWGRQQNRRIEVVLYQSSTGFETMSVLDE